jgi:hypothetical protein
MAAGTSSNGTVGKRDLISQTIGNNQLAVVEERATCRYAFIEIRGLICLASRLT